MRSLRSKHGTAFLLPEPQQVSRVDTVSTAGTRIVGTLGKASVAQARTLQDIEAHQVAVTQFGYTVRGELVQQRTVEGVVDRGWAVEDAGWLVLTPLGVAALELVGV